MSERTTEISEAGRRFQSRLALKEGLSRDRTQDRFGRLESIVGLTPLVRLSAPNGGTIWAKVESENPTECHYDRAALATIKTLEQAGFIKPGDTLIEGTSGSAGRSFAYFANRLGYNIRILVSQLPEARRRDMEQFGAELMDVGSGGIARVQEASEQLLLAYNSNKDYKKYRYRTPGGKNAYVFEGNDERVCFSNHAESLLTPQAFSRIGFEVLGQLPKGANLDVFSGTLGNGSTIKGISEALKTKFPNIKVVGVEDAASPTHYVRKYGVDHYREVFGKDPEYRLHNSPGSSVPGYTNPPFIELDNINEIHLVDEAEWHPAKDEYNSRVWNPYIPKFDLTKTIGNTSIENLIVARRLARAQKGLNTLVIFYDKADQYPDFSMRYYSHDMLRPADEQVTAIRWLEDRERVLRLLTSEAA